MTFIKKMSPSRFIVLGFAVVILIGSLFLFAPFTANEGVSVKFIDALFTATSAVCVTGLLAIDTADNFNTLGQAIIALLIQIGGLGVTSVGVGFILLARGRVSFKERILVKEALNLDSMKGIVKLVKSVLFFTLCFESLGAILSFLVFSKDYPTLKAIWISIFHSIASFNNAGFDIIGGFRNLLGYRDNVLLNLTTSGLIIFGGIGFFVIKEIIHKRSFKKLSLHSKIVISMTSFLLVTGTLLLKFTEDISWLGAFFFSTSARTAGFSTYAVGDFTNAGLFVLIILMFIGASPGSTGGGIKTTTAFTLFRNGYSTATNNHCTAYKRKIPVDVTKKAFILTFFATIVVFVSTFLVSVLEPHYEFMQVLFEVVSAFGTVGLSTGITPDLGILSKIVVIITMFIGRLGPLTMFTIWVNKPIPNVAYTEETLTIG